VVAEAASRIRQAARPLIVAGGGVIYSEATDALRVFVERTGIPVVETHAGKGSLPFDHPSNAGSIGVNGVPGAFQMAQEADLVIGIGTRWTDVTTVSQTAFAHPDVEFVNINVASFDAHKFSGLSVVGDARVVIESLGEALAGFAVSAEHREKAARLNRDWEAEIVRYGNLGNTPLPSQGEVVVAVNEAARPEDVVVSSAGSLPNDLQKLWRSRDPKSYHVEYGYSCMGYEIPGGIGVKMAAPDREVFVMVGDGSYMMMPSEIVTAVQEGIKLIVVLIQNHGFASVGALSRRLGTEGFGADYRARGEDGQLSGEHLPVDLAANAASFGADVIRAADIGELRTALAEARDSTRTTVIHVETDPDVYVPRFHWWDVAVAEVSTVESVEGARATYEEERRKSRRHL
jgi:3D-(3,5/4)-trihydroxycyclohexane-1,2-dione acylhydrolase (decyclizing)